METIVITRHKDLVALLEKRGLITPDMPRLEHTDDLDLVRGKNLIGVVPAKLAVLANSVTEVPLFIPSEWRKKEIPLDALEGMAGTAVTYHVEQIPTRTDFSEAVLATFATTFIQYVVREGIVERGGAIHKDALARSGRAITRAEFEGRPVLGHLPYHMAQHALDITSVNLLYTFARRGKVHDYDEMKTFDKGLLTYRVIPV